MGDVPNEEDTSPRTLAEKRDIRIHRSKQSQRPVLHGGEPRYVDGLCFHPHGDELSVYLNGSTDPVHPGEISFAESDADAPNHPSPAEKHEILIHRSRQAGRPIFYQGVYRFVRGFYCEKDGSDMIIYLDGRWVPTKPSEITIPDYAP